MPVLKLLSLPIGNLGDITQRAMENLASARWVLAEDTRNFKKVCELLSIDTSKMQLESFHDHSADKIARIVTKVKTGEDVLLVSDAGSPIISDPAFPLVKEALAQQVVVETIPGVSSVIVALELSGLPPHPFTFHGFLPRDNNGRERWFKSCSQQMHTHIFFESPHRIQASLDQLHSLGLEFEVAVARELTKKFEDVLRFPLQQWPEFKEQLKAKGEVVLLLKPSGPGGQEMVASEIVKLAEDVLSKKGHPKAVSKLVGKILKRNTKEVYSDMSR